MYYIILLLIGYLIGSIQIPIIAGKLLKKIDVRDYGSGNAGSTNVARVLGVKVAVVVFILDILKGLVPFLIVNTYFGREFALVIGTGTVIGHNFPVFMGFKGGKGVAISLGIITAFEPLLGLGIFVMAVIVVRITRYVSLASVTGAVMVFIYLLCIDTTIIEMLMMLFLIFLLIYKHRGNISRLIKGEENKITFKKNNEGDTKWK